MAFRFVHTADIHLDSPLRTLALREPALAELIGGATRKAFAAVIDLCLAEQVDALLIAGDLYDGEQTSMKTARFLADELRRLHEAGIRTFIIRGNHDAESRITRELTLPELVKVFGGRAESVALAQRRPRRRRARRELRPEARAGEPAAEVPRPARGRGQYRHVAHEPRADRPRTTDTRPARRRSCTGTASITGRSATFISASSTGQGDDRDARQSAGSRHQRGGAEVGHAGDDRRRPHDFARRAADERRRVSPRLRRSFRCRGLAGGAEADRGGARRGARLGDERASRRPPEARGRDDARLAFALRRRQARGGGGRDRRRARRDLDRQGRARMRRAARRGRRPRAIRSRNCAR